MNDQRMFWMVWNPNGRMPWFQHWTEQSANSEADRLAIACPGEKFFVLCAERWMVKTEVQVTELAPQEDCPNMQF